MRIRKNILRDLVFGSRESRPGRARRPRQVILACETLEGRVTPSAFAHHAIAHAHLLNGSTQTSSVSGSSATVSSSTSTSSSSSTSRTSSSALSSALQAFQTYILNNVLNHVTTPVLDRAAIVIAFQKLRTDGISFTGNGTFPSLQAFETQLVLDTVNASTSPTATLAAFEQLYPTTNTSNTPDVVAAFTALQKAVTDSGLTPNDISNVNTQWATVVSAANAAGNTSFPTTYPYFNLVTGQAIVGRGGGYGGGCG